MALWHKSTPKLTKEKVKSKKQAEVDQNLNLRWHLVQLVFKYNQPKKC